MRRLLGDRKSLGAPGVAAEPVTPRDLLLACPSRYESVRDAHPCFAASNRCDPTDQVSPGEYVGFLVLFAVIGTACLSFLRVSLRVKDDTLRPRTLLWRSRVIALAEVTSVTPRYSGWRSGPRTWRL